MESLYLPTDIKGNTRAATKSWPTPKFWLTTTIATLHHNLTQPKNRFATSMPLVVFCFWLTAPTIHHRLWSVFPQICHFFPSLFRMHIAFYRSLHTFILFLLDLFCIVFFEFFVWGFMLQWCRICISSERNLMPMPTNTVEMTMQILMRL